MIQNLLPDWITFPIIEPDDTWMIWTVIIAGTAVAIALEQRYRWAAKMSGPVVALVGAMLLSNLKIMPTKSPVYDVIGDYLVPLAIPLLLFRANLRRIVRLAGKMFIAFHISIIGTILGAFVAAWLFADSIERIAHVTGIMTASYSGGAVNFFAVKESFEVPETLTNPLLVADNVIMAGMFAVLLIISGTRFFLNRYAHPHTRAAEANSGQLLAAEYWSPKPIALLDIAFALAIAFLIVAASKQISSIVKMQEHWPPFLIAVCSNVFVLITLFSTIVATAFAKPLERIHGAEEFGGYMLYLFFFAIGLPADLREVIFNVPAMFAFCLVIAVINLIVTLGVGKLCRLDLEDLVISVNATLGGAPSAAAMAIAKGWPNLVLPALLVGIWGYVIGTFIGVIVAELLLTML